MKLTIKNMVCRHCIETVRRILSDKLNIPIISIELGSAVLGVELDDKSREEVATALESEGFELIQSREAEIVDTIKRILIELSRREGEERENLPELMTARFHLSYPSLSRMFSEVEGRSIENYFVNLRVERVKELIKYQQLSLSEIAYVVGYSSVSHLSRQFKQVTGLTPSQFREMGRRKPLPDV